MANPFTYISSVLVPSSAGTSENQQTNSNTYSSSSSPKGGISRFTASQWVPDFGIREKLINQAVDSQLPPEATPEDRVFAHGLANQVASGQISIEQAKQTASLRYPQLAEAFNGVSSIDALNDPASATASLTQEQVNRALRKGEEKTIASSGTPTLGSPIKDGTQTKKRFTEVERSPFIITCQRWIKNGRQPQQTITTPTQENPLESIFNNFAAQEEAPNSSTTMQDPNNPEQTMTRNMDKEPDVVANYIFCNVNPSQIAWEFPVRAVDQKTMGGRVQHVWRNYKRRDSYFDEPTIRFTFQSGNIMPLKFVKKVDFNNGQPVIELEDNKPGLPGGLENFYSFFELFNEPRIVNDENGIREVNQTYIFYNSRVFPRMTLAGMWNPDGLSFLESADDPNQITWTASFTVYDSFPKFTDSRQLISAFVAAGFGNSSPNEVYSKASSSGTSSDHTSGTTNYSITRTNLAGTTQNS